MAILRSVDADNDGIYTAPNLARGPCSEMSFETRANKLTEIRLFLVANEESDSMRTGIQSTIMLLLALLLGSLGLLAVEQGTEAEKFFRNHVGLGDEQTQAIRHGKVLAHRPDRA